MAEFHLIRELYLALLWYVSANTIKTRGTRGIDHPFWRAFLHDFDMMAEGKDSNGEILFIDSEGNAWGSILLFGEGDCEQIVVCWGCKHYMAAHEMCAFCLANKSTRPYTDLSPEAAWRRTERDMTNQVFHSVSNVRTSHFGLEIDLFRIS